jgi:hypothetical protein
VCRCVLGSEGCVLVPRSSGTPVATWAWTTWVVSRRRVLEALFILLEFLSPSRRIFIGSHSLPPLWFAVSVLHASRTLGLKILQVQGNGGRTDAGSGLGRPAWADRPRPISARFGCPFAPVGPPVIMHFAPSTCMILTMSSSRPRWRFSVHEVWSFMLQSPGVLLRSTSVLATIGSDFIKLMNTNKTL